MARTPTKPAQTEGNPLDRDRLTKISNELISAITSPEVIERMQAFRKQAARGATFSEAGDLMSLESLKAAGAKLPDDFRITSRVFEDRKDGTKFEIKIPRRAETGIPDHLAWGACAGGGAATVCGCAGGSS